MSPRLPTPEDTRRQRRIAIGLACLIAIVMAALGAWSIIDGHHVGKTRQGAMVSIEGNPARWMGSVQVCIGMLALALAMPGKRSALVWSLCWLGLGVVSFVMARYYR